MPAKRRRKLALKPPATHGGPRHNSTHFTRGSQLIGHQWSMLWRAVRLPLIAWGIILLFCLWLRLTIILDNHEFRMISMRALAWVWDFIGFDEMKRVDVTLADGSIHQTYMGYVPYIPDNQAVWRKFVRAIADSFLFSTVLTVLGAVWYVPCARRRSIDLMEDHHERGAELTTRDHLVRLIDRSNLKALARLSAQEYPGMAFEAVLKLPLSERLRRNIVPPYTIGTVSLPHGREQSHCVVFGTTGAGKTNAIRNVIDQALARGHSCVVFDLTGHYVEAFYTENRDYILNLTDRRCANWSVFNDCTTQSEFVAAASALIPDEDGIDGGFWERAARMLFVEMCVRLQAEGKGTNKDLSGALLTASLKDIYARLKGTVADPLTSPEAARMANSIRGVLNSHGNALRFLPENGPTFSIRDWVHNEDKGASVLFITSRHVDMGLNRALVSTWMNIAIHSLMTMNHTRRLRTWYVFDELGALHQLPALEDGMQTARSFGGAFLLGVHSLSRLRMTYGDEGARNIISLTYTKLILATGDHETAKECSTLIGSRQVRTMDEAYSYGAHEARDASTISPTRRDEPLVHPDDITNLPNLHGYLKFREGFPATYVRMPYIEFQKRASGYLPSTPPVTVITSETDGPLVDEGGGQGVLLQTQASSPDGREAHVTIEGGDAVTYPGQPSPVTNPGLLRTTSTGDPSASQLPAPSSPPSVRSGGMKTSLPPGTKDPELNHGSGEIARREMSGDYGGEAPPRADNRSANEWDLGL